jgi:hypothetical protein
MNYCEMLVTCSARCESRTSGVLCGATMEKLIISFYLISIYTLIMWFGSVFKHPAASNSIPHLNIGCFLAACPLYVMFNPDIKISE